MKTHDINFDGQYEFGGKAKTWSLIAIVIGAIAIIGGFVLGYAERTFSNLLIMGYYYACVCMAGVFFCAVQYVAQAGWSASILRVPQAFAKTLPIAAALLFVIIGAGLYFTHPTESEETGKTVIAPYLYKLWALNGVSTPGDPNYDAILAGKHALLNVPAFLIRIAAFLGCYAIFGKMLVSYSLNEDEIGGMSNYEKSFKAACIFLVIFGFTTPVFAFDVIMSLEAHWFSTMFGWYNFAAMWVGGLSVMTITIIQLRKAGYLQWITEDHLHNMGLFMFAFSIFWTYVWFAQFLLIYYANLPEETVYFFKRWEPQFKPWFWLNIVINFCAPLFVLMMRDSKRTTKVLTIVSITLIIGHWLDYFMMVMPGTTGPTEVWWHEIGPIEIFTFIGFAGLFTFTMLTSLSKFKSLIAKNHPFLQESLHHHI